MFAVYVIQNDISGKIYIGQTEDLDKRIKRHNGELPSKMRSYTSLNKGAWKVVYKEVYQTRQEVMAREKYLKSHVGRDWLKNKLAR